MNLEGDDLKKAVTFVNGASLGRRDERGSLFSNVPTSSESDDRGSCKEFIGDFDCEDLEEFFTGSDGQNSAEGCSELSVPINIDRKLLFHKTVSSCLKTDKFS